MPRGSVLRRSAGCETRVACAAIVGDERDSRLFALVALHRTVGPWGVWPRMNQVDNIKGAAAFCKGAPTWAGHVLETRVQRLCVEP